MGWQLLFLEVFWEFEALAGGQIFPAAGEEGLESFGHWLPWAEAARHHAHGLAKFHHEVIVLAADDHAGGLIVVATFAQHAHGLHPVPGRLLEESCALGAERGKNDACKSVADRV